MSATYLCTTLKNITQLRIYKQKYWNNKVQKPYQNSARTISQTNPQTIPRPILKLIPKPCHEPMPKLIPKLFSKPIPGSFLNNSLKQSLNLYLNHPPNCSLNQSTKQSLTHFSHQSWIIPELSPKLMEISRLESDCLDPLHPISNAKFQLCIAFLNSIKVAGAPHHLVSKSYGHPRSMNKLILNIPSITS